MTRLALLLAVVLGAAPAAQAAEPSLILNGGVVWTGAERTA